MPVDARHNIAQLGANGVEETAMVKRHRDMLATSLQNLLAS
jgi:hypothetical protein